jgi:hypothetical protein
MPVILNTPEISGSSDFEIRHGDYKDKYIPYDYPKGLDLRPGSKVHDKIVMAVMRKALYSHTSMSSRYPKWKHIDHLLTAYINPEWEKKAKDDKRKVEPVVIPVTFGALETLMTYMVAVFFEYPLFSYDGVGPEDVVGAKLLEKCIEADCVRNKVPLNIYTMFRDSFAYGIGPLSTQWNVEKMMIYRGEEYDFAPQEEIRVEGNNAVNIDPYQYLPDPDVPIHDVQKGEFVGWSSRTNLMSLLSEENANRGRVFNCRYAQYLASGMSVIYTGGRSQGGRDDASGTYSSVYGTGASKVIDTISLYMNIIPKDWELGDNEYPEKWLFRVAADKILISAMPLGLNHNKYPVVVNAPTFDGHSITPVSLLETTAGIQDTVDWLIQSHIANVKKSINDMLVVDPYLVNINDITNPTTGKIIRKRRAAWGKGNVMDGIGQLQVSDVTRGHLGDIAALSEMLKQVTGASDIIQGNIERRGERVSASEARGAMSSALSRLEKYAKISSIQSMYDIAIMFAYHSQQLMTQETYVKNIGEWERLLIADYGVNAQNVLVRPQDINVRFDVVPKDGTMPNSNGAETWVDILKIVSSSPLLMQKFNVNRIFSHLARMLGAKDIDKFTVETMPDEAVMAEQRAGNLIPVEGAV